MEKTLFILLFIIMFAMFLISLFFDKDWQLQTIFTFISLVMSAALALASLNVEIIEYSNGAWQVYQAIDYAFVGLSLIFSIISLLNGIILVLERPVKAVLENKDMSEGYKQ
jgi:hypothetical protein